MIMSAAMVKSAAIHPLIYLNNQLKFLKFPNLEFFLHKIVKICSRISWSYHESMREHTILSTPINKNHLGGGSVVKAWDQEICSLCSLRFEPCGCSYDGHWRFT